MFISNILLSNCTTINTGVSQGCVLSASLFTICESDSENCAIIKYADDTVIFGLLGENDDTLKTSTHLKSIAFVTLCKVNFLELNVKKIRKWWLISMKRNPFWNLLRLVTWITGIKVLYRKWRLNWELPYQTSQKVCTSSSKKIYWAVCHSKKEAMWTM